MSELVLSEGDLAESPFIDLVVAARGSSGPAILEVTRGSTSRRLYFRDKEIAAFTTTNGKESFTEFLLRRGKLAPGKPEAIDAAAARDGITPAQVMLRDRLLPTPDVASELSAWAGLLIVQTFAWTSGTYRVLAEPRHSVPPETLLELSLPSLLAQGVWKRVEIGLIRAFVAPFMGSRAQSSMDLPFKPGEFKAGPEALRAWEALRAADEVRAALLGIEPDEAARALYLYQRTGMLQILPAFTRPESSADLDAFLDDLDDELTSDFGEDDDDDTDGEGDNDLFATLRDLRPASVTGSRPPVVASAPPSSPRMPAVVAPAPPSSPRIPAVSGRPTSPPTRTPPPPTPAPNLGVDMSSIGFRRGGSAAARSGTFHTTSGGREELATGTHRTVDASGEHSIRRPPEEAKPPVDDGPLAGLFDGLGAGGGAARRAPVAPPRGGRAGWRPENAPVSAASPPPSAAPARPPAPSPAPPAEAADAPPRGPGPAIDAAEWEDLRSSEKDRIRGLRTILTTLETQNYYEMLELSPEAPEAMIKKAYFKLARRYHPDSLVDEGPIYARLAEAIFTRVSEAYELLTDPERREAYTAKQIRGEKDENDLAMEKVQRILGAEGSYKAGVRLLTQGKLGLAVEKLQEAVDAYDEEPEYRGWLGYALFRAHQRADYERALEGERMLLEAIAGKPANPELPHLMGKIGMQRKDYVAAKQWIRKSLKIQADNPEALREYKRADDMLKGGAAAEEDAKAGIKGLLGRFGKK